MMWLIVIAALAVGAAPFVLENRRTVIGSRERKGAPGQFVRLSQGVTHFRWHGPTRGPVIVAVHGLTTPSKVWDVIATGLGALGYRVLTYDLFGRGLSDAPKGEQDADFFLRQLQDLLADQRLDSDLTLMGYSMGGSIVTASASAFPHQVKRVVLLASAGIATNESPFSRFCRTTRYLGDWVFMTLAPRRMAQAIDAETTVSEVPEILEVQRGELTRKGFLPAVLASRRGMLDSIQETQHRQISRDGIPVIAIWGARDAVIPISALGQLAQWNRHAMQEVVDDADHAIAYSHGSDVVKLLRGVLAEKPLT